MSVPTSPSRPRQLPHRLGRVGSVVWRIVFALVVGSVAFGALHADALDGSGERTGAVLLLMVLDVLVAPVAMILVAWRRHEVAAITVVLLSAFSALSLGAGILVAVSYAASRPLRRSVALGLAYAAVTATTQLLVPDPGTPWWAEVLTVTVGYAVWVLVGIAVRTRRDLVASLREQAEAARREQVAVAEAARRGERARIAREMHDALGHRLSIVAMHAGALETRPDLAEADARTAAGVVRESAHSAMAELRGVLGVLDEPSLTRPDSEDVPALERLDALVSVGVGDGVTPVLRWEGDRSAIPDAVGRHLYRMVQECLTNVRKHAPGAPTAVVLSVVGAGSRADPVTGPATDVVELEVRNRLVSTAERVPSPVAGAGGSYGLTGLAERARLAGGTFSAGAHGSDFVVRVVLPCRP